MSVIATAVRHLMAAGVTGEALVAAIAEMEAAQPKDAAAERRRARDEHTIRRDSNKARRGLSNQRWREIRLRILERDAWQCQYCGGTDDLTCDHIMPLARGGSNHDDNLTAACRSCNSSKSDKTLEEWLGLQ